MKKYIAYYRVSTKHQGSTGLGLSAQRTAVKNFIKNSGELIGEFEEVESGAIDTRKELIKAIESAKKNDAILLIAALDRLSRNLTFISKLMDKQVRFTCCDMPEANEFTIHIFAALAQQERKMISERTKKALAVLKSQGKKLGTPANLTASARTKGVETRKAKAKNSTLNKQVTKIIVSERLQGKTLQAIATELNQLGFLTQRGKPFRTSTVEMLLKRNQ